MSTALTTNSNVTLVPYADLERMAAAIAKSGLFGIKTPEQAIALMLIAQAEGQHPAIIARDYDIIQGRPAKKSEAMMRSFLQSGGSVKWHDLTDALADATFSHPQGGEVRITWDMKRAQTAGLASKDNWKKFPRQMLRNRCISEGVRTVCPSATSGMYVPEEVQDFEPKPAAKVVQAPSFAPVPPDKDFEVGNQQVKPWEKNMDAVPIIQQEAKALEFKGEHELASFVIPGGPNKGIKLGDKPDAFWEQHRADLRQNIAKIPADRQSVAQDTIDAISIYLERE